jgi:hypothetical protein
MSIHGYIWLCIENEEEEETTPPTETPPVRNCFYFDICGTDPESPTTQGKPQCIYPFLEFLNLYHLNDALGDRSCVPNTCCISFLGS